jgi:hypothetical protein
MSRELKLALVFVVACWLLRLLYEVGWFAGPHLRP